MTREELIFMLDNHSSETMRLHRLVADPRCLDLETIEIIKKQLDRLCGLMDICYSLPKDQNRIIVNLHIGRHLRQGKQTRASLAPGQYEAALDAVLAAMDTKTWDGRYYRCWRQPFERTITNRKE